MAPKTPAGMIEIHDLGQKMRDLMEQLKTVNDQMLPFDEKLEVLRASLDHARNEYDKHTWKMREVGSRLVEIRSEIQDTQMRLINCWVGWMETEMQ